MNGLVDIGVNLTNKALMRDLQGVLERARSAGLETLIVTGTTIEESARAVELCAAHPGLLYATCGIHPHHASDWDEDSRQRLKSIASQDCVRAVGETGLDFNRNYSPPDAQEFAFCRQLELAVELGKPLFCHQRDAHGRFVTLLREYRDAVPGIVVHCFTDTRDALHEYLDLDCHIGITGWICDERRGLELREMVADIPAERLLLETDAPYLLPRNLDPKPASRTNEPAYLPHILAEVAHYRGIDAQALARQTRDNSRRFFGL